MQSYHPPVHFFSHSFIHSTKSQLNIMQSTKYWSSYSRLNSTPNLLINFSYPPLLLHSFHMLDPPKYGLINLLCSCSPQFPTFHMSVTNSIQTCHPHQLSHSINFITICSSYHSVALQLATLPTYVANLLSSSCVFDTSAVSPTNNHRLAFRLIIFIY